MLREKPQKLRTMNSGETEVQILGHHEKERISLLKLQQLVSTVTEQ